MFFLPSAANVYICICISVDDCIQSAFSKLSVCASFVFVRTKIRRGPVSLISRLHLAARKIVASRRAGSKSEEVIRAELSVRRGLIRNNCCRSIKLHQGDQRTTYPAGRPFRLATAVSSRSLPVPSLLVYRPPSFPPSLLAFVFFSFSSRAIVPLVPATNERCMSVNDTREHADKVARRRHAEVPSSIPLFPLVTLPFFFFFFFFF